MSRISEDRLWRRHRAKETHPEADYDAALLRHWKAFVNSDFSANQFSKLIFEYLAFDLDMMREDFSGEVLRRDEFYNCYFADGNIMNDFDNLMYFRDQLITNLPESDWGKEFLIVLDRRLPDIEWNYLNQQEYYILQRMENSRKELDEVIMRKAALSATGGMQDLKSLGMSY